MCHTEIPAGQTTLDTSFRDVAVPVASNETMPATEAGSPNAPGVLIVADVVGPSPFYRHLAALLAGSGFRVLVPDFFFREGPIAGEGKEAAFARRALLNEGRSVNDLGRAAEWLRGDHGRVGAVGFCMGATFVLDLASTGHDLVSVAYYGFPVPQATLKSPPPAPLALVKQLHGPVLAFWGDQDREVGQESVEQYVKAAYRANTAFRWEILAGVGHGFLGKADLEDPNDRAGATWSRAIGHLHEHIMPRGG